MNQADNQPEELLPEDLYVVNSTTGRIVIPTETEEITGAIKPIQKNLAAQKNAREAKTLGQPKPQKFAPPTPTLPPQPSEPPPVIVKQDQSYIVTILFAVIILFLAAGLFLLFQENLKLQKELSALSKEFLVFQSDTKTTHEIFKKDFEAAKEIDEDVESLNISVMELTNAYNALSDRLEYMIIEQITVEESQPLPEANNSNDQLLDNDFVEEVMIEGDDYQ